MPYLVCIGLEKNSLALVACLLRFACDCLFMREGKKSPSHELCCAEILIEEKLRTNSPRWITRVKAVGNSFLSARQSYASSDLHHTSVALAVRAENISERISWNLGRGS